MDDVRKAETIDAHHHLWRYTSAEYGWIDEPMSGLRRNFLPEDLHLAMASAGVDGAVAVQARQTVEETRWLLDLARVDGKMRGVVGWLPIAGGEFPVLLEEFQGEAKLKGLRHVVQAEPDAHFILHDDFNAGISALKGTGLVYDILILESQLPQTIEFVDRHPEQVFVLDHAAKPLIRNEILEPWGTQIRDLARRENVYCKVSGLVTEADWERWTIDSLRPYLDVVLDAFGPSRLMAGSDWPVCLMASEYARSFAVLRDYFAGLGAAEQDRIFGGTAVEAYRL